MIGRDRTDSQTHRVAPEREAAVPDGVAGFLHRAEDDDDVGEQGGEAELHLGATRERQLPSLRQL